MLADRALAIMWRNYDLFLSLLAILLIYGVGTLLSLPLVAGGLTFFDIYGLLGLIAIYFLFSILLVYISTSVAERLDHRTYINVEEGVRRALVIFLLLSLGGVIMVFLPPLARSLFAILYFLPILLLSISMAIDGGGILAAWRRTVDAFKRRWFNILEFFALGAIFALILSIIEAYFGVAGLFISILLAYTLFIPWSLSLLILTYLYRYPLVVSRIERIRLI